MEVLPYRFEPDLPGTDIDDRADPSTVSPEMEALYVDCVGNTDWCKCGCCKAMSTQRESVCSHDIEEMKSLIDGSHIEMHPSCITQHADFSNVCLCRAVLTVSLYGHRHHYRSADVPANENRKFQYLAYRQLTWWGWQYLGKHRRLLLPSCFHQNQKTTQVINIHQPHHNI